MPSGWLPTGEGLREDDWRARHRLLLGIVAACGAALIAWGLAKGWTVVHVAGDVGPAAALAAVALWPRPDRRVRSLMCTLALFALCADGVHVSGGRPEAHFAFFVGIVFVALYEDWAVFGVGALFVLAQHAVMGTLDVHDTFGHDGSPVVWAVVHSAFITVAGVAAMCWWKSNETVREQAARAHRRARQQEAVATIGKLALGGLAVEELEQQIVRCVRDVLEVPIVSLLELRADGTMEPRVVLGLADVGSIPGASRGSHSALAIELGEPVVVADRESETRFDTSTMRRLGLRAGLSVLVRDGQGVRGTLNASARQPRAFDADDVHFLDSMGQILGGSLQRSKMERRLRHASEHDQLTGLPNRRTYMKHLERALGEASRSGGVVAVLYGDVDRFKEVNDTMGHAAGDELLQAIAERFRGVLRDGDLAARIGGDEFAVVAGPLPDLAAAEALAQRTQAAFSQPFRLAAGATRTTVSLGLATGDDPAQAPLLLQHADQRMYINKRRGTAAA